MKLWLTDSLSLNYEIRIFYIHGKRQISIKELISTTNFLMQIHHLKPKKG